MNMDRTELREKIIEIISYGHTQYCRQNSLVMYKHKCKQIDRELAKRHADSDADILLAIFDQYVEGIREERDKLEYEFFDQILHMPFFEFCLQVKERKQRLTKELQAKL